MCIKSEFAYFLLLVPNDCEKKAFRAWHTPLCVDFCWIKILN